MNAVTFLLVYAVALSWLAPALLASPVLAGVHPRLSVVAWLATVATALTAWVGALAILMVGAARSVLTDTALTFCVETLGITDAARLSPAVATALVVVLLTVTAAVTIHTARRVTMTLVRARRSNRAHIDAVQIIGRHTEHPGVVAMSADQPTAYCVSGGRRSAIVVTTAALQLLDSAGLAAVLAHERAHLRGRHHHIVATLKALSAALPRLPLMRVAARQVPPLLEMCADDTAARTHGRAPLLAGLVALSTRRRVPEGALAAAGTAVLDRVHRLAQPPRQSRWHSQTLSTSLVVILALAGPTVALSMCTL